MSGSDRCFHIYVHPTLVNASSLIEFNLLWLWNFQKVLMFIFSAYSDKECIKFTTLTKSIPIYALQGCIISCI
jgi:hypothetical protein